MSDKSSEISDHVNKTEPLVSKLRGSQKDLGKKLEISLRYLRRSRTLLPAL